jgi:hypothetical protein
MGHRTAELAGQFEQAVAEFCDAISGLSDAQWRALCPNEERSVGVLARHVAKAIPFEMDVFREIAAGRQPATITRAGLAEMNAADAEGWADCDKEETLVLLRDYAEAAAAEVRGWDDAQLSRQGVYVEDIGEPWTIEQWIERILIGHIHSHWRSIRERLASTATS